MPGENDFTQDKKESEKNISEVPHQVYYRHPLLHKSSEQLKIPPFDSRAGYTRIERNLQFN